MKAFTYIMGVVDLLFAGFALSRGMYDTALICGLCGVWMFCLPKIFRG